MLVVMVNETYKRVSKFWRYSCCVKNSGVVHRVASLDVNLRDPVCKVTVLDEFREGGSQIDFPVIVKEEVWIETPLVNISRITPASLIEDIWGCDVE